MVKLANICGDSMQVNIFDAKTELSKLIKMIENKEEQSITIARHGKPVAVLVPYVRQDVSNRIGLLKDAVLYNGDIDQDNESIAEMFYGEAD